MSWSYPSGPYGASGRRAGVSFSRRELRELGLAVLGLSLAVVLLNLRADLLFGFRVTAFSVGFVFIAAFVSVGSGVGLHEIAHKAVAQSYGHWAEFRWDPRGIAMAFFFALLGFIYGAPGATMVSGYVTPPQNGKISAAGPATNLGLALAFLGATYALLAGTSGARAELVALILANGAFVNLILGGFNMLPVLPFDGAKVWAWNKGAYAALLGAVVAVLVFGYVNGLLPL